MPLGTEVGLGPEDIVLDGDPSPLPQKAAEPSPQFSAHFCCGQTAGWIKVVFGMELGLLPGHIVLDGEPCSSPSPKRGRAPHFGLGTEVYASAYSTLGQMETQFPSPKGAQFSANVRCGQTAGWTKIPLGMEVGLDPGDFVFDGHTHTTQFLAHVYCGQTAGWMKTPLGAEVDLGPDHIV